MTLQMTLDQGEADKVPDLSTMTGQDVVLDMFTAQATVFDVTPGRERA